MKQQRGPAAWLVYFLVRSLIAVMEVFPLGWNLQTARLLAWIWRLLMPRHYRRARAHLEMALGGRYGPRALDRLAQQCLAATAMFAVEAVCLPRRITPLTFHRYVELHNFEAALAHMLRGRGAILVTGHYGSFELIGHLLACLGFPVAAVMRPLDNVYLNRFVVESRRRHGLRLLDKKGAMLHAYSLVRDGTLLAFIGDQDAGRRGMFVDFFGKSASTYKSIGLLAMRAEVPVIIGYARRHGHRPRYTVGVERILEPHQWRDRDDPLRWITQQYTAAIESFVRAEPSQYLWIHRRWKSRPRNERDASAATSTAPAR